MPSSPFDRQPPRRILVICTQRIGDVLLATPLARSLKAAWPKAELHFLVFEGTQGILTGNPDVDHVIAIPHRLGWREKLQRLLGLWRRYDLALAAIPTDRARLIAWAAARFRVGFVTQAETGKKWFLSRSLPFDERNTHTVSMGLRLTSLVGIAPQYQVVPPVLSNEQEQAVRGAIDPLEGKPFVVLHPSPQFAYKMWRQEAWIELADALCRRGFAVVLTGGPTADERTYANAIARQSRVLDLTGRLSLAETTWVLRHARAFVGPDTAVTHIAAAAGVPTVALFGPSNPVKWGPWPSTWNRADSPWSWRGSRRQGNVHVIQGPGECVPCLLEGCDRHVRSASRCLQQIPVADVLDALDGLLGTPAPALQIPIIPANDAA